MLQSLWESTTFNRQVGVDGRLLLPEPHSSWAYVYLTRAHETRRAHPQSLSLKFGNFFGLLRSKLPPQLSTLSSSVFHFVFISFSNCWVDLHHCCEATCREQSDMLRETQLLCVYFVCSHLLCVHLFSPRILKHAPGGQLLTYCSSDLCDVETGLD